MFATLCSIYLFISIPLILIVSAEENKKNLFRLSPNIEPISYTINITTHLNERHFAFDGQTNISIRIKVRTSNIKLHANNLEIHKINLYVNESKSIEPKEHKIDNKTNFLIISFNDYLSVGDYKLNIEYKRTAKTNTTGFIRRSYIDYGNKKLWLAFTQLEPTGARKVFPCFDEPSLKANFEIIINHNKKYKALSNMHAVKTEIDPYNSRRRITYFAVTPKMSTYLVGIIISNFDYIESEDKLIRLYSRNDVINKVKYIMDAGTKTLDFMNNYTGISYRSFGFNKLDVVIIPDIGVDVAGMENWGIITIQETSAVVEDNVTSAEDREWATKVIAHECVHQWFGNLVTINWWSDLWITEGVATYFHFFITDQIEKTWNIMDRFVVDGSLIYVTKNEAGEKARPIKMKIDNPNDMMWTNYYHIYYKSAYIIRTVAQIIGEENFHKIFKNYLKKNSFQAVHEEKLIGEFAKVAEIGEEKFKDIFNNWLITPGFPIINVVRNYSTGDVEIKQTRYINKNDTNVDQEYYWIPINYVTEDKIDFDDVKVTHWMPPSNESLKISGFNKDKWIMFNKQQFGYYCVNYDETNWKLIINALKSDDYKKIHVRNRLQLINDAFMLIRANKLSHEIIFKLMEYLEHETDFIPWIPVWKGVEHLKSQLQHTKYLELFDKFFVKISNNLIKNLSFEESTNDTHIVKYYRVNALTATCESGSKLCANAARGQLIHWMKDPLIILPQSLKNVILCSGLREAKYELWNSFWHMWLNNPDIDLLNGLACSRNTTSLMKFLYGVAEFDSVHHTHSLLHAINAVSSSTKEGVYVVLVFMSEHWQSITELTPEGSIKDLIINVSQTIFNENQFFKLQDFIRTQYFTLIETGLEPHELMFKVLLSIRYYRKRNPVYEKYFFNYRRNFKSHKIK
ncbi:hypothetical protein PV328_011560 [Microctonus aethiopoides]|uniref:Aminopeptidase n=1 Tax=Microctonus aethiopoides TaxID=144406 RepID=A0AA39C4P5_9HYME|nr:hypothetical protein PV328_011560 [Microctonus aethiopoides]